jgi:hypothetical protein
MENEKMAQLEAQYQKEIEIMKNDIARLTNLLEQALRSRLGEGPLTQPTIVAQYAAPQNIGALETQFAAHFLVPHVRIPPIVDLIVKEAYKGKVVEMDNYDKPVTLEERMREIEGVDLYDPIRTTKMCWSLM